MPRSSGKPAAAAAPKRKAPPVPADLAQYVLERAEYRCDRCGISIVGRQFSRQHRRARGAGGRRDGYLHTAANLVVMCGSATSPGCHSLAENHERAQAYAEGFAIKGEAQDPAEVPILRHGVEWVIPTADGWAPADPIEGWAA